MSLRNVLRHGLTTTLGASLVTLGLGRSLASDQPPLPEDLADQRAQVAREAAALASSSIVQIETIGGDERVEGQRVSVGPTTGVVVREDGLIVTSTFNFVHRPTTILVVLPDGQRYAARRVAGDRSRMLTLLKAEGAPALVPAQPAPLAETRVGQTAIALGRPFEAGQLVQSRGIVSALGRLSGKAIQTDARVSPHHYGGALVDLFGRTFGVIVPLSPLESGAMAGADWYDSGIGFAIPLEHVLAVLPRWAEGADLVPGLAGVRLTSRNPLEAPATMAQVRPGSPAHRAGLRKGDVALSVGGESTRRVGQFQAALARRYAGETVVVVARRGEKEVTAEVQLAESIAVYRHPQLGVLPAWEALPGGVGVAELLPGGAAQQAGLQPGDLITAVDGQPTTDRTALEAALAERVAGDTCRVQWRRGDQPHEATAALGAPQLDLDFEAAPRRELAPRPSADRQAPSGERKTGPKSHPDIYQLYVPEEFAPGAGYGIVAWLGAGAVMTDSEESTAWRQLCRTQRLVLLTGGPAGDDGAWSPSDLPLLKETIDALQHQYGLLASRSAVCAEPQAAPLAAALVFGDRPVAVRGLATYGAAPLVPRHEINPERRLWLHSVQSPEPDGEKPDGEKLRAAMKQLEDRGYWATFAQLPAEIADQGNAVREQLSRWLAGLDRL